MAAADADAVIFSALYLEVRPQTFGICTSTITTTTNTANCFHFTLVYIKLETLSSEEEEETIKV